MLILKYTLLINLIWLKTCTVSIYFYTLEKCDRKRCTYDILFTGFLNQIISIVFFIVPELYSLSRRCVIGLKLCN